MVIIGIDPSLTSTGICVMDEQGEVIESLALSSKHKGVKRLADFKSMICKLLIPYEDKGENMFVAIEGYAFSSANKREALGELGGMIRLLMYEFTIGFIDVQPSSLKKYLTNKGNADKVAIAVAVQKQFDKDFPTTDQTDAFVLAVIGRAYLGLIPELPKYRAEVIDKIKKAKGEK